MTNPYFWPGTKILKSVDNDFNWRRGESIFVETMKDYFRQSSAGSAGGQVTRKFDAAKKPRYTIPAAKPYQKTITAFSKAKASKK